jgi:protein-S-isoprenylcysteine O-methyltransferase Ste14
MQIDEDSARVRIPPPVILFSSIVIGWGLNVFFPLSFIPENYRAVLGASFIVIGLGIINYCAYLFKKAQTEIKPWKKTSNIITTGLYGISRNPIYTCFVIVVLGAAFAINSLWVVLMLIPMILIIDKYVIAKEERYLEKKFGEEYKSYKNKVRRWL